MITTPKKAIEWNTESLFYATSIPLPPKKVKYEAGNPPFFLFLCVMKEIKLPFLVQLTLVLISALALGYLAFIGKTILSPLFFSFLMALLFLPFSNFLERRLRFSRAISTFMSVLIMTVALSGIFYFFVAQLSDFSEDFPQLQKQVTH
ncbi:MAG TPA: hypothetical protein DCQ50_19260 [Chryseobacterium sp.]|nr:hypothetical protein [Chryseobacterium sp.]